VGAIASLPLVVDAVNAANASPLARKLLDKVLGVHPEACVPDYHRDTGTRRARRKADAGIEPRAAGPTRGKVALFVTCYGEYNMPQVVEDLTVVLQHNGIAVQVVAHAQCCGMPKLELGDLEAVDRYKQANLPALAALVADGWDLLAPIPSCVLMFKQEIPLMYPDDSQVLAVKRAFFDPFEYLMHRHQAGLLDTRFARGLGKVAYHVPCHQRVQNIGPKTRDVLRLVPGTELEVIERCSGHDGTYGLKSATWANSRKIAKPVVERIARAQCDVVSSDCPMAAAHLAAGLEGRPEPRHPLSLLRLAYGI
jgi:Fe-S oxidoreductase